MTMNTKRIEHPEIVDRLSDFLDGTLDEGTHAEIEAHLQTIPGVGQAVVVGDRQPYLCTLIALDPEALDALCAAAGVPQAELAKLADSGDVRAFFEKRIEEDCNSKLARDQTVKRFKILPAPFGVDSGELTPTLKVKRNVVNEKYAEVISSMYD